MITKNDCMAALLYLEDTGINIDNAIRRLAIAKEPPHEVLQFIAQHRGFEAVTFYEFLRKRYNNKKSKLYKNILFATTSTDVITTLANLLMQITLYSNKLANIDTFLREVRATEITAVLAAYYETLDSSQAVKLLTAVKNDLLVLESLAGKR